MLLYRASHIWCIEVVYKLRVTFGVDLTLKDDFIYRTSQSNSFLRYDKNVWHYRH